MAKTIDLTKETKDLKEIIEEIQQSGEECVLKEGDKPIAAVLPFVQYQDWKLKKEQARGNLSELLEGVWKRNKDADPKEVEELVNEAVQTVRKEERERLKASKKL
jgi:hypothetical protein